jgi:general secretion pathway protein G
MMAGSLRPARGYTLIELLVVLAVLGILAAMTMPLSEVTVQRDRERELRRSLWEIRDALDAYHRAVSSGAIAAGPPSGYPARLAQLTEAYPDTRADHQGQVLRFLRRVPRDPFAAPDVAPELSWRLRSYASPAERPAAGDDVYDVSSSSDGVALDGTSLKDW